MVSTAPKITLNTVSPTTMKPTKSRYPMLRSRRTFAALTNIEANDITVTATSTTYAMVFEPSMPNPNRTFHGSNKASTSNTAPSTLRPAFHRDGDEPMDFEAVAACRSVM
jgi:hypothetical protein